MLGRQALDVHGQGRAQFKYRYFLYEICTPFTAKCLLVGLNLNQQRRSRLDTEGVLTYAVRKQKRKYNEDRK